MNHSPPVKVQNSGKSESSLIIIRPHFIFHFVGHNGCLVRHIGVNKFWSLQWKGKAGLGQGEGKGYTWHPLSINHIKAHIKLRIKASQLSAFKPNGVQSCPSAFQFISSCWTEALFDQWLLRFVFSSLRDQ